MYAIYRAMKIFDERNEPDAAYTIFTDPTVAINRVLTDRRGPGQAFTKQ